MKRILLLTATLGFISSINAQNPIIIAQCDFDGIINNCVFHFDTTAQNIWQIGTPQKPFFGNAFSFPKALQTDTINPYPANNQSEVILKFANNTSSITDWTVTTLSFWHKYQTVLLSDFGRITYSLDNGVTWFAMKDTYNVQGTSGYNYDFFGWDASLLEIPDISIPENEVTGTSSTWVYSQFTWQWYLPVTNVRGFTPDTIDVKFEFNSDSNFDNMDGWIIDNILIQEALYSGINEPHINSYDLQVYPNPASTAIDFNLSGNEIPESGLLTDLQGRVVKRFNISKSHGHLDLDVSKGSYFFSLLTKSGNTFSRLVLIQ